MKAPMFFIMVKKLRSRTKEGMIFTVEPMINSGKLTKTLKDGWTAVKGQVIISTI